MSPALADGFLTTAPLGKSLCFSLIEVKITNDEINHFKVYSSVHLEHSQCCATTPSV